MSESTTFVPLEFRRRGVQRVALAGNAKQGTDIGMLGNLPPSHDTTFLIGLGRAFYWQKLIDTGIVKSGSEIARLEGLHHSTVNELLRLTLLAPEIIDLLIAGCQPRTLTLMRFQRNPLPVEWQAQRALINKFAE